MNQAQANHADLTQKDQRVFSVYGNSSLASAHKRYLSGTIRAKIFAERSVTNITMQRAENLIAEKTTKQPGSMIQPFHFGQQS